jgi:excisionase family DNA binding protein
MNTQKVTATSKDNPPPLMLPPRKCAAVLGLPEYTIREWVRTGYIKSVPCGRKRLINVDALRRKLEES